MKNLRKVLSSVVAVATLLTIAPAFVGSAKALDASCPSLMAGDEIKVTGKPAIYVLDVNMRYRYFFSGDVYKTYKQNYNNYKEISQACFNSLSSSQFPASINPRPGSRVMKYVSTDDLYVGVPGGVEKITDSAARTLYGSDYASNILSVSVVEWPALSACIKPGTISTSMVHPGMVFRVSSNTSKIWYMSYMNKIHEISPSALESNFLNGAVAKNGKVVRTNIYTVPDSAIVGITTGDPILTPVSYLTDRTYAGYDCATGNWTQPVAGSTGTGTTTTTAGGNLTVSLASANPNTNQATLVPAGLNTLIKTMDINFAAGNTDVNVTSINLHRLGITSDSDVQNVYLMEGNVVLTNNIGITNGMVNFSNPSGLFKVPANTTKKITVGVTLSSSASTRSVGFSIDNAAAIVADNGSTVGGTFPITSAMYTAANVSATAGGIQITNSSAPTLSVNAGQTNFEVGRFTVQGQNQLTRIDSMAFTVIGSTSAGDLTNIKLINGTQQVGFASSTVGNRIVFDLTNNPLQLAAGTTILLSVQADVVGGVNRTFQLSLQHSYDVVGEDLVFNTLLLPTLTGSGVNFPMLLSNVTVNAGTLVVNRSSSSPSVNVLPGGTNQTVAAFTAQANGEAVQLMNVNVDLTGTMNPAYITNLKLVDDQGVQIGSTVSSLSGGLSTTTNELTVSGFNYTILANSTRVLSVKADISSSATGTIQATLTGMSGQGRTSLSNFSVGNQTGNLLTANNNILTVSLNNQMSNTSVVAGQQNVRIGSFSLQAGGSSNVAVSAISLTTNTGVLNVFDNLRVVYNSNPNTAACAPGNGIQIGQTFPTTADNQSYTFSLGSTLNIPASSSTIVDVCANVRTGASFGAAYAVKVNAAGVSAIASATNQVIANTPVSAVNGQTIATTGPGALTYFLSGGNPAGAQVGMGTQNVKLASYRLQASNNEDLYINTVTVVATSTIAEAFGNFRLVRADNGTSYGNGSFSGTVSPFTITWSGVRDAGTNSLVIPAGKSVDVDVIADANSWSAPGNLLNNTFYTTGPSTSLSVSTTLRMSKVEYQGYSSSVAASTTSNTAGNTFTLLRTTLRGAFANGETVSGGYSQQSVVGAIAFTAGANDPAYLYTVNISGSTGGSTANRGTTGIQLVDKLTGQVVASSTINTTSSISATLTLNATGTVAQSGGPNGTAGVTISPSQTRVFLVRVDTTAYTPISNSTMNWTVSVSGWGWSDGERDQVVYPITADPTYNLPIVASPANLRW